MATSVLQRDASWYLLLLSIMATLLGYGFGIADHLEQFPMIYRALDPNYAPKDWFVNATAPGQWYNPRYYFVLLTAAFSRLWGLAFTALLLTVLSNWGIAKASFDLSKTLHGSVAAAWLAALLVFFVVVPTFGSTNSLQAPHLLPGYLSLAFLLNGIVQLLKKRLLMAALLLALGILWQPRLGIAISGLAWGIQLLYDSSTWRKRDYWLGSLLLFLAALAHLWPYSQQVGRLLPTEDFLAIYVHARHPHHFLASYFLNPREAYWALTGLLLLLLGVGVRLQQRSKAQNYWLTAWLLALMGLSLGAYLFVEIWPTRLWATIQGYRFLFLAKWLMLVLASGILVDNIQHKSRYPLLLPLFLGAVATPLLFYTVLLSFASTFWEGKSPKQQLLLNSSLALVLSAYGLWTLQQEPALWGMLQRWLLFALLSMSLWLPLRLRALTLGLWLLVFTLQLSYWLVQPRYAVRSNTALARQYSLADHRHALAGLGEAMQKTTPKDALFLTPPGFGAFRLYAKRAIIIDAKAYPFADAAVRVWLERLEDLYGKSFARGLGALQKDFSQQYKEHPPEKLRALAQKYGADYVIGYAGQELPGKLLYEDAHYRVSSLSE